MCFPDSKESRFLNIYILKYIYILNIYILKYRIDYILLSMANCLGVGLGFFQLSSCGVYEDGNRPNSSLSESDFQNPEVCSKVLWCCYMCQYNWKLRYVFCLTDKAC